MKKKMTALFIATAFLFAGILTSAAYAEDPTPNQEPPRESSAQKPGDKGSKIQKSKKSLQKPDILARKKVAPSSQRQNEKDAPQ